MNENSKKLQATLYSIKRDVDQEKNNYIDKCRAIQEALHFDLTDDRAVSKMASVVQKINDANTTYYLFLKLKLEEVHKIASSYEVEELDYETVEQIYLLVQFINQESTIENSFDGSVNMDYSSVSLGTMAVVTYHPSLAAKEIELRWKEQLKKVPESKKRIYEKKKIDAKEEKVKYQEKLAAWEKSCIPIKAQREKYITEKINNKTKQIQDELLTKYYAENGPLENQRLYLQSVITNKTRELDQLGVFKWKEKKILREEIQSFQAQLNDVTRVQTQIMGKYQEAHSNSNKQAKESIEALVTKEAEKLYPFPVPPVKPESVVQEEKIEAEKVWQLIVSLQNMFVRVDRPLEMKEIYDYFMGQKTRGEIAKGLSAGIKAGYFEEDRYAGMITYFSSAAFYMVML